MSGDVRGCQETSEACQGDVKGLSKMFTGRSQMFIGDVRSPSETSRAC